MAKVKNKIIAVVCAVVLVISFLVWWKNYDGSTLGKEITKGLIRFSEEINK
jgi:hypothetical protein